MLLADSIVERNRAADSGGGIFNQGTMRIERSVIVRNRAGDGGGGIHAGGWEAAHRTTITDSVIRANVARAWGGGIHFDGLGRMRISRTRIVANQAIDFGGGGILAWSGYGTATNRAGDAQVQGAGKEPPPSLIIGRDTRIARNTAARRGGGIWNDTRLRITGATITANTAGERGGGLFNSWGGSVTLRNAASIAGNSPDDCRGTPACRS